MPDPSLPISSYIDLHTATPEALARLLEQLVTAEYAYVQRLSLSILNDPAEAEDAVQETFIAVSRALPGFRGEASLRTWVARIAVNACRARLRRNRSQQSLLRRLGEMHADRDRPQARPNGLEAVSAQRDANRLLWQAVDALDDKHRLPLVLRYVHELELPEIARMLDVPLGTLHSRLHYARQKLQSMIEMSGIREELSHEYDAR
jgi:RNA polymerase sigma-70 factor (ECF subfamily)